MSAGRGREGQQSQPYWGHQPVPVHPAQLARQTFKVPKHIFFQKVIKMECRGGPSENL